VAVLPFAQRASAERCGVPAVHARRNRDSRSRDVTVGTVGCRGWRLCSCFATEFDQADPPNVRCTQWRGRAGYSHHWAVVADNPGHPPATDGAVQWRNGNQSGQSGHVRVNRLVQPDLWVRREGRGTLNIHRGPRLLAEALCAVVAWQDPRSHEVHKHPTFAILTYAAPDPSVVTVEAVSWRRLHFCWHLNRHDVSLAVAESGGLPPEQVELRNPGEPGGPRVIVNAAELASFLADVDAMVTLGTDASACPANTDFWPARGVITRMPAALGTQR
jgi:hypothetical protein